MNPIVKIKYILIAYLALFDRQLRHNKKSPNSWSQYKQ